jgi:hypothetical protein
MSRGIFELLVIEDARFQRTSNTLTIEQDVRCIKIERHFVKSKQEHWKPSQILGARCEMVSTYGDNRSHVDNLNQVATLEY